MSPYQTSTRDDSFFVNVKLQNKISKSKGKHEFEHAYKVYSSQIPKPHSTRRSNDSHQLSSRQRHKIAESLDIDRSLASMRDKSLPPLRSES